MKTKEQLNCFVVKGVCIENFQIKSLKEWSENSIMTKINKKDGYRQRNVRQFLHILASPGYASGIIAVNVTWMEREFNACQTHRSMYRDICLRPIPSNSKVQKFKSSPF